MLNMDMAKCRILNKEGYTYFSAVAWLLCKLFIIMISDKDWTLGNAFNNGKYFLSVIQGRVPYHKHSWFEWVHININSWCTLSNI